MCELFNKIFENYFQILLLHVIGINRHSVFNQIEQFLYVKG